MPSTTPALDGHAASTFAARTAAGTASPGESDRVQMARGVACFLLVAFHVIGAEATSGMHVADDSGYRLFTNLLAYVRMPLFTFLSGFVYAYRPVRSDARWDFTVKKLRRLGLPFVVATTLMYLGHSLAGDKVMPPLTEVWRVYLVPIDHLWFVSSLLCVFALIVALEGFAALATLRRWLLVFALAVTGYLLIPRAAVDVLGSNEIPYLLPYFLAGLGANRFRSFFFSPHCLYALAALLVVVQAVHSAYALTQMHGSLDVTISHTMTGLVIGIAAGVCALRWLPRIALLQSIGTHSYAIYLYHPVFVAVVRTGLKHAAIPQPLLFSIGMTVGIAGPVALALTARRMPWAELLLVGKTRRSPNAATVASGVQPAP